MSTRPWMPLNVEDYLSDTSHLTTLEHGAYLLLIMRYWRDGGLPESEALIARYAGLTPDQWSQCRDVLAAFFDDGWKHRRIDAELARAADVMEKRRASGQRGGSTRQASAKQVLSERQHTDKDTDITSSLRSDVARTRASRLPEKASLTDEMRQDASEAGLPSERHEIEFAKMRDWSLSSPNGARKDWRASWRNWCRKAASELPRARGSPPRTNPALAAADALMERIDAVSPSQTETNPPHPRLVAFTGH